MKKGFLGLLALVFLSVAGVSAAGQVMVSGGLEISGTPGTDGITFPDNTTQTTAASGTVTSVGTGAGLTGGPVTGSGMISIATGGVTNTMLQNSGTSVWAGTGLSGGGWAALGQSVTLNLGNTAVIPGSYKLGNFTVDQQGRITAASSGAPLDLGSEVTGTLPVANGGTGAGTAAGALANLGGVSTSDSYIDPTWITSLSGSKITGDISVDNLTLPVTTATAGIIKSGTDTLIHTYGTMNFFAGTAAGNLTMTGSDNTGTGYHSLNADTSGYSNTAIGVGSLAFNTTGSSNTAGGEQSLVRNTTGSNNTAIGAEALIMQAFDNNGNEWNSDNTAIGFQALYYNRPDSTSDGIQNTAVGSQSLYANTTGHHNTAIGYQSLYLNTTGHHNAAIGEYSLGNNTSGAFNTSLGVDSGTSNATGSYNTFIGDLADAVTDGLTNATAIGHGAEVDASDHVLIGNIYVSQIGGAVPWSNLSDRRAKKDIRDITRGLDFIESLRPVQFRMKHGNGRTDFGFIAQDIEALLGDNYNILGIGGDAARTLSLRYTDFIPPMVKAMQQQQTIIEAQQEAIRKQNSRIAELEQLIAGMDKRLEAIEAPAKAAPQGK
jgi:trimeric autotransporter adhesin